MRIDLQERELAEAICEYIANKFHLEIHVDQIDFNVNDGEPEATIYV